MARITVILPEPAGEALTALADREWRQVSEQAGYLLVEALRQRGVLPAEPARVGGEDDLPLPSTAG